MKVILIDGRLGRDAKVETSPKGNPYIRFSVANNVYNNGKEETEWYDITSFDDFVINKRSKLLTKGQHVIVSGVPSESIYTPKDGGTQKVQHRILADRVDIVFTSKNDLENTEAAPVQKDNRVPVENIAPINIPSQTVQAPVQTPQYNPVVSQVNAGFNGSEDDLPF